MSFDGTYHKPLGDDTIDPNTEHQFGVVDTLKNKRVNHYGVDSEEAGTRFNPSIFAKQPDEQDVQPMSNEIGEMIQMTLEKTEPDLEDYIRAGEIFD